MHPSAPSSTFNSPLSSVPPLASPFPSSGVPLMSLLEVVGVKLSHIDTAPGDAALHESQSNVKFERQAPPCGFMPWIEFPGLLRTLEGDLRQRPGANQKRFEYINSAAPQRAVHPSAREGPTRERLTYPASKV